MKKFYRFICFLCIALIAFTAVACSATSTAGNDENGNGNSIDNSSIVTDGETSNESYTSTTEYTETEQAIISSIDFDFDVFSDNTAIPEDATVINGSETNYTIKEAGSYVLTGEFPAGVTVKASIGEVHIYLNGATINSDSDNALAVKKGNNVIITAVSDTENTITSSGKNALNSNSDLYINGTGTLNVTSTEKNAIKVDSALKIVDATINLTSANHGVSAYSFAAKDCKITVLSATKDGIHAEMDDEITAWTMTDGYVVLFNVDYTCDVLGDGVQADTFVYIDGGNYNIKTTANFVSYTEWQANADNYDLTADDFRYAKSGNEYVKKSSKTISSITNLYAMEQGTKGIKVGEIDYETDDGTVTVTDGNYYIIIADGTFTINSADDAIHANSGNVTINGGTFTIATLDDGVTADALAKINGGVITVTECFEGVEGGYVEINGGKITLTCADDGINAAADDTSVKEYVKINGGFITIDAEGDGIDSNGTAQITGGTVYVFGPTAGGNSALDSEGTVVVSGGTVIAVSREAMDAISFGTPYVYATNVTLTKDSTISINGVVSVKVPKTYSGATVYISSASLTSGTSYTVTLGSLTKTVTATAGSVGGMGGGMGGNNMGGMTPPNGGNGGPRNQGGNMMIR